jgi:predicted DNA-binding transcriptional regulator AlpA
VGWIGFRRSATSVRVLKNPVSVLARSFDIVCTVGLAASLGLTTMLTPLPETGFVRLPQILAVFPVSRSAWWLGVKTGKYPASVKLGPRTTAWRAEDIRSLIERKAAESSRTSEQPRRRA